ncbi:MAG TPA: ECF transporter S component [Armatimonadota bacterium]|nr:ECF transporter S component [Armatimonadota bacterium]HQK91894.1 ECF transporter S component [Armatimonadota bacterium]
MTPPAEDQSEATVAVNTGPSVCPVAGAARDLTLGGLFGALAIVLPIVFHAVGMGKVFLPMYLPILALGLLASWRTAALVGLLVPLISAILTGMPPLAPPIAFIMMAELAALGLIASVARSVGLGIWLAAVLGLLAARAVGVLALLTIGRALGYEQGLYEFAVAGFVASWPGIALQLTVVPSAVYLIERTSIFGRPARGMRCV